MNLIEGIGGMVLALVAGGGEAWFVRRAWRFAHPKTSKEQQ